MIGGAKLSLAFFAMVVQEENVKPEGRKKMRKLYLCQWKNCRPNATVTSLKANPFVHQAFQPELISFGSDQEYNHWGFF